MGLCFVGVRSRRPARFNLMRFLVPSAAGAVREGFLEASLVCLRSRPRSCARCSGRLNLQLQPVKKALLRGARGGPGFAFPRCVGIQRPSSRSAPTAGRLRRRLRARTPK